MAIPDYQACMLPLLKRLADGKEHKLSELVDELGSEFGLTDEELSKLLPSGTQKVFTNRVGWARTYLITSVHWVQEQCFVIRPTSCRPSLHPAVRWSCCE